MTAAVEPALARLRAAGANVVVAKADIANYDDLAGVIADIDHTLPPLRGVVHAAGVLDDGIALQQTRARLRTVLAPKVLGGWHLHALTAGRKLDFFVMFSSAAGLLGSPGQSNYAAANAGLDGLAAFRRARGLPAVSIDWGPWSGAGMAAPEGKADRLTKIGMGPIDPARGLNLFGRLLNSPLAASRRDPGRLGDISTDSRRLASAIPRPVSPASRSAGRGPRGPRRRPRLICAALDGVPPDDWQPIIEAQLREQAARVLRLAAAALDIEQPLNGVGIDSLMAIELKNRIEVDLGVTVPMVKFLEGPSVRDLAGHVAEALLGQLADKPAGPATTDARLDAHAAESLLAQIDSLSDDQVDALLADLTAADQED